MLLPWITFSPHTVALPCARVGGNAQQDIEECRQCGEKKWQQILKDRSSFGSVVLDSCTDVGLSYTTFGTGSKPQPSFSLATPATSIPLHCLTTLMVSPQDDISHTQMHTTY